MPRQLILTPYEYHYLEACNHIMNDGITDSNDIVDIPHILLSALTMSGVDDIRYIAPLSKWQTSLIHEAKSTSELKIWSSIYDKADLAFAKYEDGITDEKLKREINSFKLKIIHLLFSLEKNSGLLVFQDFAKIDYRNNLPLELTIPFEIFSSSIQAKSANLPIMKYDIKKTEIRKYFDVIKSKEFSNYKDSQSEIELNQNLTFKTIKAIETAGKDLYKKKSKNL